MKWHTATFGSAAEIAERENLEERIAKFWLDFSDSAEEITRMFRQLKGEGLVPLLKKLLEPVHHDLVWEISRAFLEGDTNLILTVTAGDNFGLRPLAKALLQVAPNVPGWKFTEFKVALADHTMTSHTQVSRDYNGATGKIIANDHGCFDLVVRSRHFHKANEAADLKDIFWLIPPVIGEELFEVWIDNFLTEPNSTGQKQLFGNLFGRRKKQPVTDESATPDSSDFQPLEQLRSALALAVADRVDSLPTEPCWQRQFPNTTVMKSNDPEKVGRFSFTTPYPEVVLSHGRRFAFHSANFTRHDELFCYLKLVDSFIQEDELQQRYEMEDRLDKRLREAQAGCMLGGGIGFGVSFIDLIVSDLPKAVEILRDECRQARLPKTSWLLFLDAFWRDEWVGMFEDSPAPPQREDKQY